MDAAHEPLARLLAQASGADPAIDRAVEAAFGPDGGPNGGARDYSASVERCTALLRRVLPGWSWHVGWGPSAVLPYARLRHGAEHVTAEGPTVPLALLKAILAAARGERDAPAAPPPTPAWRR